MNISNIIKIMLVNLLVLFIIIIIGSILLRAFDVHKGEPGDKQESFRANKEFDRNTIRSTYPMYSHLTSEYAMNIFTDYAGPETTYSPFTGWRRKAYNGLTVNVEDEYHTRLSLNHNVNNSIWFFGGSTLWGTGSDDKNTIPSHYARVSGDDVWNLGESGYNSFQEFIQLSMLLLRGIRPSSVIFYDGVNESIYCNTNNKDYPTHSRVERWEKYMGGYEAIRRENIILKKKLRKKIGEKSSIGASPESIRLVNSVYGYIAEPYLRLYKKATDKRVIGREPSENLKSGTPFSEFHQKEKYKNCDKSKEKVKKAASATVRAWLMAYDILNAQNISLKIFLQPTSQLAPNSLQLDYLVDSQKQQIVDESASYKAQYAEIRKIWSEECGHHNACESFYDISSILDGVDEEIYIDAMHIGPRGNKMVAKEIYSIIKSSK